MAHATSRAVETTRFVDARVSRRCRRRRRLFGVAARASKDDDDDDDDDAFACVDVGNSHEHAFLPRELERACAVVRTRCFYEIEDERRAEPVTFSFDDDDDDNISIETRASKPRLRWWEDRVASETVRETMFQRVGMRGVRTFAATTRADADGTPLDADVVASIRARASTSASTSSTTSREHPIDSAALRRWSVVRARDAADADSSLFVVAGTLDVHLGPSLPGEALVGARPSTDDTDEGFDPIDVVTPRRAYVFNVCVAPEFRGLGVAERLLARAHAHLRDDTDVVAAYAHVEIDNHAARRAYEKASYVVEFEQHRSSDDGGGGAAPRALLYRRVERDVGCALKKTKDS